MSKSKRSGVAAGYGDAVIGGTPEYPFTLAVPASAFDTARRTASDRIAVAYIPVATPFPVTLPDGRDVCAYATFSLAVAAAPVGPTWPSVKGAPVAPSVNPVTVGNVMAIPDAVAAFMRAAGWAPVSNAAEAAAAKAIATAPVPPRPVDERSPVARLKSLAFAKGPGGGKAWKECRDSCPVCADRHAGQSLRDTVAYTESLGTVKAAQYVADHFPALDAIVAHVARGRAESKRIANAAKIAREDSSAT